MRVSDILDQVQERLHDGGVIWSRAELLDWLNDGYRQMLAESHCAVRPVVFEVPPHTAWAGTYEWEDAHAPGTFRVLTRASQIYTVTHTWELQHLEGIAPEDEDTWAVTHLWERAMIDSDITVPFRFVIEREHERPLRVYWDNKQLVGTSTRELDLRDTTWWNESGEPIAHLKGTGREASFELFEVVTSYNQGYECVHCEAGIPRHFAGDRTYGVSSSVATPGMAYSTIDAGIVPGLALRFTDEEGTTAGLYTTFSWEADLSVETDEERTYVNTFGWEASYGGDEYFLGVGNPRWITSPDRHYLAAPLDDGPYGAIRDFKTSEDSVLLWHVVINARPLTELDSPLLIPRQCYKYLRWFVLGRAYSRQGEGQRPDMAEHYLNLFRAGVGVLSSLGPVTKHDRVLARETYTPVAARPLRVRLPSNYPQPSY